MGSSQIKRFVDPMGGFDCGKAGCTTLRLLYTVSMQTGLFVVCSLTSNALFTSTWFRHLNVFTSAWFRHVYVFGL